MEDEEDNIQQDDVPGPSSRFVVAGQVSGEVLIHAEAHEIKLDLRVSWLQTVGFSGQGNKIVTCKWHLQTDWIIRGNHGTSSGTTQISQPANAQLTDYCCWGHPLDLVRIVYSIFV